MNSKSGFESTYSGLKANVNFLIDHEIHSNLKSIKVVQNQGAIKKEENTCP